MITGHFRKIGKLVLMSDRRQQLSIIESNIHNYSNVVLNQ
jgi:hypothetical protein